MFIGKFLNAHKYPSNIIHNSQSPFHHIHATKKKKHFLVSVLSLSISPYIFYNYLYTSIKIPQSNAIIFIFPLSPNNKTSTRVFSMRAWTKPKICDISLSHNNYQTKHTNPTNKPHVVGLCFLSHKPTTNTAIKKNMCKHKRPSIMSRTIVTRNRWDTSIWDSPAHLVLKQS